MRPLRRSEAGPESVVCDRGALGDGRVTARASASRSGLVAQISDPGLGQFVGDGGVHCGFLGGVAGLSPEDAAKAGWRGSGDRPVSGR